jgi:HlyD family secretion protein
VVFLVENDRAKMVPVERGISDDSHTEILKGIEEGQEVISGGYKAISRDLEDGKRVRRSKETGPETEGDKANKP